MMEDACACHLLQNDCGHESKDNHKEMPCDSPGDCCDEDCSHDAAEPPFIEAIIAATSAMKKFSPYSTRIPPEVYFVIFVPPEN